MSKHTEPANLTTRLLEHEAKVSGILTGNDFPGFGKHRATVEVTA